MEYFIFDFNGLDLKVTGEYVRPEPSVGLGADFEIDSIECGEMLFDPCGITVKQGKRTASLKTLIEEAGIELH